MRLIHSLACGAALVATAAMLGHVALAQAASAKPAQKGAATAQAQPPAEVQHAMLYLKVLISGLQSDKVEQPVKGVLVGCLYNHSLGKITESMDKIIAENPGKIRRDDPNQVLSAMVSLCGYNPDAAAPAAAAPGKSTPNSR